MPHISSEKLLAALRWRYASKSFDETKKIPDATWAALEEALVLTPSSYGLQPWQFLVVQNLELKTQLRAASWNQRQITECSHFLVFTARPTFGEEYVSDYMAHIAQERGVPIEKLDGFKKGILHDVTAGLRSKIMTEWNSRQCYIALGNFLTAAALLGVDACPMEGLDPLQYDQILGLESTPFRTVVACAVGYRHAEDKSQHAKKIRFAREKMIRHL